MDVGHVAATLFAPRCVACGLERGSGLCRGCVDDYLPGDVARCARCALRLPRGSVATRCGACLSAPPHFDAAFALGDYSAPLDRMVLALKGRAQLHLAPAFAAPLAERLRPAAPWHAVLPLPLAFEQHRARGFNQSLELARPLARALRLPLRADVLMRTRATAAQHLLPREERQRNVRDAFAVASAARPSVDAARLLVVDDVMTSGATLDAAALALKRAGAAHVTVAVVARTP